MLRAPRPGTAQAPRAGQGARLVDGNLCSWHSQARAQRPARRSARCATPPFFFEHNMGQQNVIVGGRSRQCAAPCCAARRAAEKSIPDALCLQCWTFLLVCTYFFRRAAADAPASNDAQNQQREDDFKSVFERYEDNASVLYRELYLQCLRSGWKKSDKPFYSNETYSEDDLAAVCERIFFSYSPNSYLLLYSISPFSHTRCRFSHPGCRCECCDKKVFTPCAALIFFHVFLFFNCMNYLIFLR